MAATTPRYDPPTTTAISDYGSRGRDDADDVARQSLLPSRDDPNGDASRNSRALTSLVAVLAIALSALSLAGRRSTRSSRVATTLSPYYYKTKAGNPYAHVQKIVYIIRHGEKIRDPANATAYDYACLSRRGRARADHLVATFLGRGARPPVHPTGLFSFNYDNGARDCRDEEGAYRTEATLRPLGRALRVPINNRHGAKPDLCGLGAIEDTLGLTDSEATLVDYNHQVCHHPGEMGSPHDFGMCCNIGAAEAIRGKLFEDPAVTSAVLVAWEHANIGYLAEALMSDDVDNAIGQRDLDVAEFIANNPAFRSMVEWPDSSFDAIWALWFDPATRRFARIDTDTYIQGFGD